MVPDLTGSVDIKLNRRVSLQRGGGQIGWRLPDIALSGSTPVKPSGDYIPLGGFALEPERAMPNYKTPQIKQIPTSRTEFKLVCVNCDALGFVFDFPENAPTSTVIKCRHCGAPRGTLGELRRLSSSDRQDLFGV
jgi:hypothetical protein